MTSTALNRFALLTAACTLALIGVGGLVTSHGAGMAVPDWPNTYGYNMFFFPVSQWVGGIFYEHTHRLWASGVGLLTSILALWLYGRHARRLLRWLGFALVAAGLTAAVVAPARRSDAIVLLVAGLAAAVGSCFWPRGEPAPPWLRRLGVLAFGAVVVQGVLGGLRVVLLKDELGILHAALAQLFFVLICALTLFTSPWWQKSASDSRELERVPKRVRQLFIAGTLLIFAQLLLGAAMRHQHAGLAIPDFPSAYGRLWPALDPESIASYNRQRIEITAANPITAFQVALQMAHRILALGILLTVGATAFRARQGAGRVVSRLAWLWFGLIAAQVLLGAATIWSNKAADVATAHVLVGAVSLAMGAIGCMVSRQVSLARETASSRSARPISPWPRPAPAASSH